MDIHSQALVQIFDQNVNIKLYCVYIYQRRTKHLKTQ